MRSAIIIASSRSWVTWMAVMPSAVCSALISWRTSSRMRASRFDSGSSSSSSSGSMASARPSATRWRCPPESCVTLRSPRPASLSIASISPTRRAISGAATPRSLQAVADVLRTRHVRPQRVGLEHHRHAALLGRLRARCRGRTTGCAPDATGTEAGDARAAAWSCRSPKSRAARRTRPARRARSMPMQHRRRAVADMEVLDFDGGVRHPGRPNARLRGSLRSHLSMSVGVRVADPHAELPTVRR